ncbi:MAG: ribosome-associated translation inhibitor RaiA [Candidatus Aminicenantes bacterium]|jgi:putative sigma-54 modulation protein
MNINYTARHTTLTPEIKKHCERRLKAIEKLLGYPVEADLILSVEKYRHKAEINIKIKGATLNTVEETHDMFSSMGLAFDRLEKRVKKEREKLRERKRRKGREVAPVASSPDTEEQPVRVIPSRDFSLKPMSVDEALLQLETRKKEVFVFRKFDSEKWAVLYKREDGHFGIVEPEE